MSYSPVTLKLQIDSNMTTPYQPLHYPQPVTTAADESCCGPECAGCCAKPGCCLEPACCSRVGACPCFCTGSTAAFSFALCALWMALPMLIVSMTLPDFFEVQWDWGGSGWNQLGLWQLCGSWSGIGCIDYSQINIDAVYWGDGATFNALRSLVLVSTVFTGVAAILAPIRLAAQQRAKSISAALNYSLIAVIVLGWSSAATAFALSFPIMNNWSGADHGAAWAVLVTAVALLTVAMPLHIIAHCHYQRTLARQSAEQPGMDSSVYPAAPVFAHPQPQWYGVSAYPTAAAVAQPPPPAHGYAAAIPPTYMYAR